MTPRLKSPRQLVHGKGYAADAWQVIERSKKNPHRYLLPAKAAMYPLSGTSCKRGKRMFRYGIIIESDRLRIWQQACIDKLGQSGLAKLCGIVRDNETQPRAIAQHNLSTERAICGGAPSYALGVSVESLASSPPMWQLPKDSKGRVEISKDIRDLELDFFLLFGSVQAGLSMAQAAKFGVWCFVYGDITRFISTIPCFWEIYKNEEICGAALLRLVDGDCAGILLKSAYFEASHASLRESVETVCSWLPQWPLQVCSELQKGVATYFAGSALSNPPLCFGTPNRFQILRLKGLQARHKSLRRLRNSCFRTDWNIARLKGKPNDFVGRAAAADVSILCAHRKGRFLADPFAFQSGSNIVIFCEDYSYEQNKGVIAACELSGETPQIRVAIEESFHLSYPQVFQHNGSIYCMPELSSQRRVALYRATDFPYRWEFDRCLINDFAAVDSTLLQCNGMWWLFCTDADAGHKSASSHLCVWFAPELFGPWSPHPKNPVKIDVRSARPAGPVFKNGDAWYRPAQDCSRTYGGSITINKIEILTQTDFAEIVVGRIRPPQGRYNKGLHTISSTATDCVVDVKRYIFDAAMLPRSGKRASAWIVGKLLRR
jgi:hypothetical protein